jgi:hypothetical protein
VAPGTPVQIETGHRQGQKLQPTATGFITSHDRNQALKVKIDQPTKVI